LTFAAFAVLALVAGASHAASGQGLSGYAEAKGFAYSDRVTDLDPWVAGWQTLFVKQEGKLGPASYTVSGRAEAISSHERGPLVFDPADRELRRTPLSLREAWLRLPIASSVDLQAGRFFLGWGKTDGYSPADAFLPRDLSDPFADERLPVWGARATGQLGVLRLDGVWALTTTPWRLPVLSGRNAPIDVSDAPIPVYLVDGTSNPPADGFGAARILVTAGEWDLGLWGRTGVRPAPLLVARVDQAYLTPEGYAIPADRRYAREKGAGVEVSRVTGSFVLRGEASILSSSDPELGQALIWTLGLERAFGDGTLLVTFAANARGTEIDEALLFDRAFLPGLIVVWDRTERWGSWRIAWTNAFDHGDGLLKGEVTDAWTDTWKATLGVDLPYGSRYGPFGARWASRRAYLAVRRAW
jgi:hypothetical protein